MQAIEVPGTRAVTALVLVGAGSRFEKKSESGISHFLEHLFFKGAKKYQTPKAVSAAVDAFGGEFNAFTGKEYAGYFVKSGAENLEKSLDVLSDMLLHARFDEAEIEKERGVILEEMAMYLDAPMYQISWDFERLIFGDQPLGRDQIGTRKFIESVQRADFRDYCEKLYVPENTVITLAGAVNESDLERVETFFDFSHRDHPRGIEPTGFDPAVPTQKIKLRSKKTEQFHLSFGVRAPSEPDEKFPALRILACILGGNMSSRMFQNVREEKGLCYSIRTSVDEYSDAGILTTRAGVKLTDCVRAASAIGDEYNQIASQGISEKELENAKNYLCGRTDLQTEDTENVAHHFGKNTLLYDLTEDFEAEKAAIKSVSKKSVDDLAARLLRPENFHFAGIGPEIDEEKLQKIVS